jgi:hypothetical protein
MFRTCVEYDCLDKERKKERLERTLFTLCKQQYGMMAEKASALKLGNPEIFVHQRTSFKVLFLISPMPVP